MIIFVFLTTKASANIALQPLETGYFFKAKFDNSVCVQLFNIFPGSTNLSKTNNLKNQKHQFFGEKMNSKANALEFQRFLQKELHTRFYPYRICLYMKKQLASFKLTLQHTCKFNLVSTILSVFLLLIILLK